MHPHYATIFNNAVFAVFAVFASVMIWRMSRGTKP